jgi:hypothetical protein
MRFHLGPIPDEFAPDESWQRIREPGPVLVQFLALPLGVLMAGLIGYGWSRAGVPASLHFESRHALLLLVALLLSFPALIIVHELLHAVVYPRFGLSQATIVGAWPRRLLFYAHHSGPLGRDRFLAVFAMPFLVISVLPLALAAAGLLPSAWFLWAAWFSTWNALLACGDCLGFLLIASQVPRAAVVQNQSWITWWKPVEGKR